MNTIINDIREKIRNGNPITRLIIINGAFFVCFSIFFIIFSISGGAPSGKAIENFFLRVFALPLSFDGLIYHPWTLITYMFAHLGVMHIFWNMITLFWFGEVLSQYTSGKKIIPLYILGGIAGGLVSILLVTIIPTLNGDLGSPLIGASAGVTAIIVAAATLVPEVRMNMMFIGPVKLLYVALFVIFIDVLNVASFDNIGGNLAHLGGALMGYIFILQYKKGRDISKPISKFFDWFSGIFSARSKGKMKVVYKRAISDEEYNQKKVINQKQVDAILDKISRSGYESLSKTEKDILFKASTKK